jgi:hypothetical protein
MLGLGQEVEGQRLRLGAISGDDQQIARASESVNADLL